MDLERGAEVTFKWVTAGAPLADARQLIAEFGDKSTVDLGFQDFEAELANLPAPYSAPGGGLLAVRVGDEPAGCCAFKAAPPCDYPNAAELKRLYVRKIFRGFGLGQQLVEHCMTAAAAAGYDCLLLDTLDERETVRGLYSQLGFEVIPPYYFSPLPGAHHLRAGLTGGARSF